MKPIRYYAKATIYFRDSGSTDGYEVSVYGNIVVYFDQNGNERVYNIHQIAQIVNYHEEKINTKTDNELSMPDPIKADQSPKHDLSNPLKRL